MNTFHTYHSSIKTSVLRNLILPLGDLVFGQKMMSRLNFLEKAQWWHPQKIYEKQFEYLSQLIQISYKEVPIYRNLMNACGVEPHLIKKADDLIYLPVMTKDMLRAGYPGMTTRSTGQRTYEACTSGSTGKNFYVMEDAFTAGWYRATFLLCLEWAGWKIGETHFQTGMTTKRSFDRMLKDWAFGCHYSSAYLLDDTHLEEMLSTIEKYHIKYIFGYPASLYYLAKYAKKCGWNQAMKSAVTWGDMLYPHYRHEIESSFMTKVYDTYGCAEGIHISAQCEYGNYHIHALDGVVEFLDDNEKPVKPGEEGNIVVTRLHPGPMPLIRYAVGDRGIAAESERCPCGRGYPLMKSIQGRNTDVVFTPSGNRLIVHFFTGILEHFPCVDAFQVVQNTIDSIQLCIVPRDNYTSQTSELIIESLKQKGCSDLQINIELVDELPLSLTGKNRFVISNLPKSINTN